MRAVRLRAVVSAFSIFAIWLATAPAQAAPNCDQIPAPPICECRGRTGPLRAKCLRCIADPEREECVEQPSVSGTINPRYLIMTIVYAPPGTAGAAAKSSVEYGTSSTIGTATAVEDAFKGETETSATASLFTFMEASVSGGYSTASSDGRSIEVKKSTSHTIKLPGAGVDGINHDYDVVYLWLNPQVGIVARDDNAQWALGTRGTAMDVQWVYVSELRNPATMRAGVAQRLRAAGLVDEDYQQILSQHPLATGGTTINPDRYRQTDLIYPYEPPLDATAPLPSWTTAVKNSTVTGTSKTLTSSYWVGYSVQASVPFADWFSLKVKTTGKFTWTSTSKWSSSNDSSQSASLTITSPSAAYTGPTAIAVYWDTLYGSFMFAPAPLPTPSATGTVTDAAGKPVPRKEVWLHVGRKRWRTFTNQRGEYKFFATTKGVGFLEVDGKRARVLLRPKATLGAFKIGP